MSRLTIKLESRMAHANLEKAALAAVFSISETGMPAKVAELFLSLGEAVSPASLELTPGRYLVETRLPSGEKIADTVTLPDEQVAVLHLPEDQVGQMLGQPAGQYGIRSSSAESILCSVKSAARSATRDGKGQHVRIWRDAVVGEGDTTRSRELFECLAGIFQSGTMPTGIEASTLSPVQEDERQLHFYLNSRDLRIAFQHDRAFLLIERDRRRWLLALPLPWFSRGQSIPLNLAMPRQSRTASADFSLGLEDPDLSVPLSYLAEGAVRTAGKLLEPGKVQEMLMDKLANPLGAALGGYILLQTGGQLGVKGLREEQAWHPWLGNLQNWFPWLPDGAVQNGWLKLTRQHSEQDVEEARRSLLEACRRGLPYYTRGLAMLVEGLRLFSRDGDQEAANWLKILQPIAWRADMSQVFCCLQLS